MTHLDVLSDVAKRTDKSYHVWVYNQIVDFVSEALLFIV